MTKKRFTLTIAFGWMIAFSIWAVGPVDASAQVADPGHHHEAHTGHDHGSGTGVGSAPMVRRPSHGGQMTVIAPLCFEAVYRPKETRLYCYAADQRPVRVRDVEGQISMKVRGSDKVFHFPLKYVAPPAGSTGHGCLAVAVDVSGVRNGDMSVTFELANLPNPRQPQAAFSQTFALSMLQTTVVPLDESDRALVARQEVCAVTGGRLGSMGTPVKVLVGDQPVYLCCKGCLGRVEKNPDDYLAKAVQLRSGH
ncbi:MAG: hypothetical protein HQ582_10580 [Planctomycetes bacterium]|nr:hypothetical protein [Planctomycetota bacterium]